VYATRHSLRSAASHSILIGAFIYCSQLAEIYRDKTEPINPFKLEVCMGMEKTGIPWVPWDSHGNGSKTIHGMGMGWEWELSA